MTQAVLPTKTEKGFTLFEILLAVAILGIVSAIGFTSYTISLQKTRDGVRKNGLMAVKSALEAYMNDMGVYPQGDADGLIVACGDGSVACTWGNQLGATGRPVYMKNLPAEPRTGYRFYYRASTDGSMYQLYALLENPNDPDINRGAAYSANCDANEAVSCNYGVSSSNTTVDESI
jgi:prepilin-type N-terminal cleavage/methylation domain-containing protein